VPSEEFRESARRNGRREIAVAIIRAGDAVLVTQRGDAQHLGGLAEFPGGQREEGETLEECAVREVREEVGLDVRVVRRLATARHDDARRQLDLTFFECECVGPRDLAAEIVTGRGARWVARAELAGLPFPPANGAIIQALAGGDPA
jgi:mutator protein MutT